MFAETEQKILQRLTDRMPAGVHVGAERDVQVVAEMRQKAPACWVIHDGYTVGDAIGNGSMQQIIQRWFVVLCAKSARGQGAVDAARDQVAELAEAALSALLGYHLGGGKYLRLEEAPGPVYDAGYVHLPLAFSNAATFKGQP